MSDHEVNLKILLEPAVARGELSFDARNRALAACADEVADRVIADNRDQVLSLSLEQLRSRTQSARVSRPSPGHRGSRHPDRDGACDTSA